MEEGLRYEALPGDGHATDRAEGGMPAMSLGDREQAILSSSILR